MWVLIKQKVGCLLETGVGWTDMSQRCLKSLTEGILLSSILFMTKAKIDPKTGNRVSDPKDLPEKEKEKMALAAKRRAATKFYNEFELELPEIFAEYREQIKTNPVSMRHFIDKFIAPASNEVSKQPQNVQIILNNMSTPVEGRPKIVEVTAESV